MRFYLASTLALFVLLLSVAESKSQGSPSTCSSGIVVIDTIVCDTIVDYDKTDADTASVEWETIVGVVSGDTLLFVLPGSITFQSGGPEIDSLGTVQLFDLVAEASVRIAVEKGLLYGEPCSSGSGVSVAVPICVIRSGSGPYTTFSSLDKCITSDRVVEHCQSGGITSVALISTTSCTSCNGGEMSCQEGSGSIN